MATHKARGSTLHDAHDAKRIRASIVTVSDTRTLETDESGTLIEEMLVAAGHEIGSHTVVKDDARDIGRAVQWLVSEEVDALIIDGGTGISRRDVTIEAVDKELEKRLDGFGEAFRRLSFDEIGPRGILSRAIAGTIASTVVFVLPGSPKAVKLAMERLVLPILPHAVGLLR